MWVMANVFANDLQDVAVGQPVDVITDVSRTPIPGRVDYIASLADPGTKAVSVRVVVPNTEPGAAPRHVRARADQVGARASRHPRSGVVGAARRSEPAVRVRRRRRTTDSRGDASPRLARRRSVRSRRPASPPAIRSSPTARSSFSSRRASERADIARHATPAAEQRRRRHGGAADSATRRSGGRPAAPRRAPHARPHRRRHLLAQAPSGRRISRRLAAGVEHDDAVAGTRRRRSRATDHRADRDGAERPAESRRHAIGVAVRSLEHSRHVRRRHRSLLRATAGVRATRRRESARRCEPGDRSAVLAVGTRLSLRAAELRSLGDGAARAAGLGARQGVPRRAGRRRRRVARRRDDAVPGARRSDEARRRRTRRSATSRRRSARTTATAAADSSPRAASSSTCADSAASSRSRTSATSSSP